MGPAYTDSAACSLPRTTANLTRVTQRNRRDDRRSEMLGLGWIGLDAAVDGGQSSDGYSRVAPLPGRAWPHRRRLDGWAAGMGSVHMSLSPR